MKCWRSSYKEIEMYEKTYFQVAMTSLESFNILRRAIPELHRWSNIESNRAFIALYFSETIYVFSDINKTIERRILYDGLLHSINDIPAIIRLTMSREMYDKYKGAKNINIDALPYMIKDLMWHHRGLIHRDNDAPALIKTGYIMLDGGKRQEVDRRDWYQNDARHRYHGAPAVIDKFGIGQNYISMSGGFIGWYKHGLAHRANGKPAYIARDGSCLFAVRGELQNIIVENKDLLAREIDKYIK